MGKTGSGSAAVLPSGKSVAVGRGLSHPLILCGGRIWLLADMVLLVALSWLCHPPVASLSMLLLSHPRRNSLFVGISTFLARRAHAGTAGSPRNHLQTSYGTQFSRTCPGKMGGSQSPPSDSQDKTSLSSGTLFPSSHPRFSWGCPCGVPALHAVCSGPVHVCTHMPLACEMKPPTTWDRLGINLKILPGLNWKKSSCF